MSEEIEQPLAGILQESIGHGLGWMAEVKLTSCRAARGKLSKEEVKLCTYWHEAAVSSSDGGRNRALEGAKMNMMYFFPQSMEI